MMGLIPAALRRLIPASRPGDMPHIHMGPGGRPYACEDVTCTSPSLSLDEV